MPAQPAMCIANGIDRIPIPRMMFMIDAAAWLIDWPAKGSSATLTWKLPASASYSLHRWNK